MPPQQAAAPGTGLEVHSVRSRFVQISAHCHTCDSHGLRANLFSESKEETKTRREHGSVTAEFLGPPLGILVDLGALVDPFYIGGSGSQRAKTKGNKEHKHNSNNSNDNASTGVTVAVVREVLPG